MVFPSNTGAKTLLKQAFSPGQWWKRAAQVLGISQPYAFDLSAGRYPLTKQQLRTLVNYCDQRHRARKSVVAKEIVKLERIYAEAAKEWASALQTARALEIQLLRQGRK